MTELEHISKCIDLLTTGLQKLTEQAQQTADILRLLAERINNIEINTNPYIGRTNDSKRTN